MARLSILSSIFKAEEFLFDFLMDVKRQTIFNETEVLLLDCNRQKESEDYKIIEPFLSFRNFKYIYLGERSLYDAWNHGIQISSSEFLTNWNVDDRRSYNSLELQVKFLEDHPDVDLCYGLTLIGKTPNEKFEDCESPLVWPAYEGTIKNQLMHNSPHCLPVWRKKIHDKCGLFDTKYFSAADYDMWFKVLKSGGKLYKIPELVGIYYENPSSISRNPNTLQKAVEEVLEVRQKYSI